MKRILFDRQHDGFGDWIMMSTVIKTINIQRPDVDVYYNMTGMSTWLADYMRGCDIRAFGALNTGYGDYDAYIAHVVYNPPATHSRHLIASMIDRVNASIPDLDLKYDPAILAQYVGPVDSLGDPLPERYILMPSVGIDNGNGNTDKEWGYENFYKLAKLIQDSRSGYYLVQIERPGDPALAAWLTYGNVHLSVAEFHRLVAKSSLVVCLENGLSHYAGHNGANAVTIYMPASPCKEYHTAYPRQTPITGEFITPEYVFETIRRNLGLRS